MVTGSVYGVVLNDSQEIDRLAGVFSEKPFGVPPFAPVVYIKPRVCLALRSAPVVVPADMSAVELSSTVALLFGHEPGEPVAAALALDVGGQVAGYYRPAVAQRCRDTFLPLGAFADVPWADLADGELTTKVDGVEVHRWSLSRLVRGPRALIQDLTAFMTLAHGDVLLVGLPGDPPPAAKGSTVVLHGLGLPQVSTLLTSEAVQ